MARITVITRHSYVLLPLAQRFPTISAVI